MAKIVVLDGFTLNPGDLSWQQLQALGDCDVHERTPAAQTVAQAGGDQIVLTNKTVLDRPAIEALDELACIGVLATGYNVVDCPAADERGIVVTNVPNYATAAVAQAALALLLELTHHVGEHHRSVRQGRWAACEDFSYRLCPLVELDGLTMGIVGFGRIGRAVARRARAFGMKVLAHDPAAPPPPDEAEAADLDTLFARSDVVSLHCPLTPETHRLINTDRLAQMKPSAFLINTSRGALVDAGALAEALAEGRIAGAGLDVLAVEPPPDDCPLLTAPNCVITPHIAWAARAARQRLMQTAVDNVRAFLDGRPQNVVNTPHPKADRPRERP